MTLPAGVYELALATSQVNRIRVDDGIQADTLGECQGRGHEPSSDPVCGACRIRLETFSSGEPPEVRLDIRPLEFRIGAP